jgi:hypothetical protein
MNAISVLTTLRISFAECFFLAVLVGGALTLYALRKKGDVLALFSHGQTVFKLEAKERNSKRK